MSLKFLIDVNASGAVAEYLRERAFDIEEIRNIDPEMADESILDMGVEENRIIITTDKDFEEMIWLQNRKHPGILRLENVPRIERLKLLEDVLDRYSQVLEDGGIIIAETHKFRVRRR